MTVLKWINYVGLNIKAAKFLLDTSAYHPFMFIMDHTWYESYETYCQSWCCIHVNQTQFALNFILLLQAKNTGRDYCFFYYLVVKNYPQLDNPIFFLTFLFCILVDCMQNCSAIRKNKTQSDWRMTGNLINYAKAYSKNILQGSYFGLRGGPHPCFVFLKFRIDFRIYGCSHPQNS